MHRFQIHNIGDRFARLCDRYEHNYVKASELNDYINRMFMTNTTYFTRAYRQTDHVLLSIGLNAKNKLDVYLDIHYRVVDQERIFISEMYLEYRKDDKDLFYEVEKDIEDEFDNVTHKWDFDEYPEVTLYMTEDEVNVFLYGGLCQHYYDYDIKKSFGGGYMVTVIDDVGRR